MAEMKKDGVQFEVNSRADAFSCETLSVFLNSSVVNIIIQVRWLPYQLNPNAPIEGV